MVTRSLRTRRSSRWQLGVVMVVGLLLLSSAGVSAAPATSWVVGLGSTGGDAATGVAVDGAGNVYVVGSFEGTVDFDPGAGVANLTSAGSTDVFIAKYSEAGALIWARQVGGTGEDAGLGLALDGSANVYVVGSFNDTADFDPSGSVFNLVSAGQRDAFVLKLTSAGLFVWAKHYGDTGQDGASRVALDGAGNPHVAGSFMGTVDFDPGAGTVERTAVGGDDAYALELTSAGAFVWVDQFGGASDVIALGIDVDSGGNVYVIGHFEGTVDMDPGAGTFFLVSGGGSDVWLTKLDTNGAPVWAAHMGGADSIVGTSVAVDASGNVYAAGTFAGLVDLDPGAGAFNPPNAGGSDVFVTRLTGTGVFTWGKSMGGAGGDAAWDIDVDGGGVVTTAGGYQGTADFDPGAGVFQLAGDGSEDAFISQLDDATGGFVWAAGVGSTGMDLGYGVATGSEGQLYEAGLFSGTVDFDPGVGVISRTSGGAEDAFLWALGAAGPTVTITTPPQGASYDFGQLVLANYTCTAVGGATLVSCTGPVPSGAAIDTATPGPATFSVTGTDSLGGTTTVSHTYQVGNPLCGGVEATLVGTSGPDVLVGTALPDVIWAGAGDDVVRGRRGNDIICLGPGDDIGRGGAGSDRILADGGDDEVRGNSGDDLIKGAFGRDVLEGDRGDDRLIGGGAVDRLIGGSGDDELIGRKADDRLMGKSGNDLLVGDNGLDRLWGGKGMDTGRGGRGPDLCMSIEFPFSC